MPKFNLTTSEADRELLAEMARQLGADHAGIEFPVLILESRVQEHGRWLAGNQVDRTADLVDDGEAYRAVFASAYAQAYAKRGKELQAATMYYAERLQNKVIVPYAQRYWIVPRIPNGWELREEYFGAEHLMLFGTGEAETRAALGIPAAS